jgi:hypothetical protein
LQTQFTGDQMQVQQIAIYESLKEFMLKVGYAQAANATPEMWSIQNDNDFKALMTFMCGVAPAQILVPTTREYIHSAIVDHPHWVYKEELEYADGDEAPAVVYKEPVVEVITDNSTDVLIGSSLLGSTVMIQGKQETLGTLVASAHTASGLSVEDWNDLSEADREQKLADHLVFLNTPPKAETPEPTPAPTPEPTPEPTPAPTPAPTQAPTQAPVSNPTIESTTAADAPTAQE